MNLSHHATVSIGQFGLHFHGVPTFRNDSQLYAHQWARALADISGADQAYLNNFAAQAGDL